MERFRGFGGVVISKDPSDESIDFDVPVPLRGGRNLLKRSVRGFRRRPGFGALAVVSEAVIDTGSSPKGVFPGGLGDSDSLFAIDNGDLLKYDGSDSFDQVTKSLSNNTPSYGVLGGYTIVGSGGLPLKYDGSNVPSPLGSKLITPFEPDSDWSGDQAEDTDNEVSGTACLKLTSAAPAAVSSVLTNVPTTRTNTYGINPLIYNYVLGSNEYSTVVPAGILDGETLSQITLGVIKKVADLEYDGTIRIQYAGVDGKPDGTDIATATIDKAAINALGAGSYSYLLYGLDVPVAIPVGANAVCIIIDLNDAETVGFGLALANVSGSEVQPDADYYRAVDGSSWTEVSGGNYPSWKMAFKITSYIASASALDLYTDYPDESNIIFHLLENVADAVTEGANSYIRFETDSNNYFEHLITNDDCGVGQFQKNTLARGGRYGDGSDFVAVGAPDWADINNIRVGIDPTDANDYVLFDFCYLHHRWAPPESDKVFVADGRVFVVDGRTVYYSFKWNPNKFEKDTYMQFPSNVIAVLEAGDKIVIVTERDAWGSPSLSAFPDYDPKPIDEYGCVGPKAACKLVVGDRKGAAWMTKNSGIRFWDGSNPPIFISDDIGSIFTDYEANSEHFDPTRSSELIMLYHPRYKELWVFYPTLFTGETNIKYAWVFNCKRGEWMPLFEWGGDSNIIFASIYRDQNDGLYKLLLTDSDGSVWHEGYVGSTILDDTTSKDGYVDANTTGAAVKGYVELPFIGGWQGDRKNKDQWWDQINYKFLPGTTNEFLIDISYKVAAKASEPDDSYSKEIEVVFGDSWTSLGDRSTTQADAKNVVERNVKLEDSVVGHALAIKLGQFSAGGSVEWELYGTYARGGARGGNR